MKRALVLISMVCLALGARAEPGSGWLLYWTLDLEDDWSNEVLWWERPSGIDGGPYDVWLVAENTVTHDTVPYYTGLDITVGNNGMSGSIGGFAEVTELLTKGGEPLGDLSDYTFYSAIGTWNSVTDYEALWTSYRRDFASLGAYIQTSEVLPVDIWNTAVVPEPTSALLLLLGIAGLSLRRKRA